MSRSEAKQKNVEPSRQSSSSQIGLLVSAFALVVSMISAYFTYLNRVDNLTYDTIKNTYTTFFDLDKLALSHPELSHMFAVPSTYTEFCTLLAGGRKLSDDKTKELYFQERAIANLIFDIFEHTLYQSNHSAKIWDTTRQEMQNAVLIYLTGRVLKNPRLLYFWSLKGGGLQAYYEPETINYYRKHVLDEKEDVRLEDTDPFGPYRAIGNIYSPKCVRGK